MRTLIVSIVMVVSGAAAAQDLQVTRRATFIGKNELSAQVGFQASLGGGTPSGAKLFFDYSRHLKGIAWFNVKLNPSFASAGRRLCVDRFGNGYDCGFGLDGNGNAVDALAGVKLKWTVRRAPIVPYMALNVGVVGVYDRPFGDNGVAAVLRQGGGFRYFVTPHVGLGAELSVTLGPGFYGPSCAGCNNAHTELYRAFDMSFGAEFIL